MSRKTAEKSMKALRNYASGGSRLMPGGRPALKPATRSRSRASIDGSGRRVSSPELRWGQLQLRVLSRQSSGYGVAPRRGRSSAVAR
jgi:hypothetical protein